MAYQLVLASYALQRCLSFTSLTTDYGRQVRKLPSLHNRKITPTTKFLDTAEAYFSSTLVQIFGFFGFMPSLGVRSPCHQRSPDSTPSATKGCRGWGCQYRSHTAHWHEGEYMIRKLLAKHKNHIFSYGRSIFVCHKHGLRTPNEGINQRILEILANLANKICISQT